MTETAEAVLGALLKMDGACANLKLESLAQTAQVSYMSAKRAVWALRAAGLIETQRDAERGNCCYTFTVTEKARFKSRMWRLADLDNE